MAEAEYYLMGLSQAKTSLTTSHRFHSSLMTLLHLYMIISRQQSRVIMFYYY